METLITTMKRKNNCYQQQPMKRQYIGAVTAIQKKNKTLKKIQ